MPDRAQINPILRANKQNNYGRSDVIDGTKPKWEFARVQGDEVKSWTVSVSTIQVTPDTRVLALIEYGSGNAYTRDVIDASDHIDVSVAGDYVKVDVGLVQARPQTNGGVLLANSQAKISAGVSADVFGFPVPTSYFPPPVIGSNSGTIGPPPALTGELSGTGNQPLPARLASYQVAGVTGGIGVLFFMLFDQPLPVGSAGAGNIPVWIDRLPAPDVYVSHTFQNPMGFANSVQWGISSTDGIFTAAGNANVFGELVRIPTGLIVPAGSLKPLSGGLF
jgi:hypothetical protein